MTRLAKPMYHLVNGAQSRAFVDPSWFTTTFAVHLHRCEVVP